MSIRRAATVISTCMVAIVVMLAVPIAQLRTVAVISSCCCPDPTFCHCPHEKPDHGGQPSMRTCHRTQQELVSPQLPAFAAPVVALAAAPARAVAAPPFALATPHAAPAPARPDAPS